MEDGRLGWFCTVHRRLGPTVSEHSNYVPQLGPNYRSRLLGLSYGGSIYPWKSAKVIATIAVGAITLVAFALWEVYGGQEYPLIPMHLLRNRHFIGIIFAGGIATMVFFALLVLWPIQLSTTYVSTVMGVGWKSCVSKYYEHLTCLLISG